jgi:hypothetical protein
VDINSTLIRAALKTYEETDTKLMKLPTSSNLAFQLPPTSRGLTTTTTTTTTTTR